jgi:DNA polymerase-3 subunit gamma/tau
MTLLRMAAFRLAGGEGGGSRPAISGSFAASSPAAASSSAAPGASRLANPSLDLSRWQEVVGTLELGGAARQLAANCAFASREGNLVRLTLDPAQSLLRTAALIDKLAQALSKVLGATIRVELELAAAPVDTPARAEQRAVDAELDSARRSLDEDPTVRGFKEKFGATLKPDSVKPL